MTSAKTRIAVTGGSGILATALQPYFPTADFLSHESCDVGDWGSVRRWFGQHRYDLILHLGAETSHNATPEQYWHTNVIGTTVMVQWAKQQGARFVYTSTDYCYPGTGQHSETDPVFPRNAYSWSKLGGECAAQLYDKSVIIRGSWYETLHLQRAATDAYTSKVPVATAAMQIATIATSGLTGIVNVGGPRRSLYEIALEANQRVQPIPRSEVQCGYPFPRDVSLNLARVKSLG